jgi:hypothetical protein
MLTMLAACAALSLVVMSLAVPRELEARRRARRRAAQEKAWRRARPRRAQERWAELIDRRA